MPIREIPNTNLSYYLVNFDSQGRERAADDGRLLSQVILEDLAQQAITDVFIMSHGWLGDIPSAINQYDRWVSNLMGCAADLELIKQKRPGFKPLLIGLHWPSKPFGDEDAGGAFDLNPAGSASGAEVIEEAITKQIELLDAPDEVRPQLETIFKAYLELDNPATLPDEVRRAYLSLNRALGLADDDRAGFDPEEIFHNTIEAEEDEELFGSFGGFSLGDLLAPLRMLSFWRMKDRARSFGETGAGALLRKMQHTAAGRDVRFHLMGHSFGCIVVTAMTAGSAQGVEPEKPVNSIMLVQGALSLWAYCPSIPSKQEKAGYFNPLISHNRVSGPIVTTQSEHDTAVGLMYPLAAGIKRQVAFGVELPKYGAIGTFGIQGLEGRTDSLKLEDENHHYGFKPGRIYNLESSQVISRKEGAAGAHSDIAHPEVAHAWWEAVMVD